MNDEKWFELKEKAKEKFSSLEETIEENFLEDDLGNKIPQKTEVLIFNSDLGRLRIERTSHPKIIEKKAHYHKGAGSAKLEFVVDPNEFSHKINIFKNDNGTWMPLEMPAERLSF